MTPDRQRLLLATWHTRDHQKQWSARWQSNTLPRPRINTYCAGYCAGYFQHLSTSLESFRMIYQIQAPRILNGKEDRQTLLYWIWILSIYTSYVYIICTSYYIYIYINVYIHYTYILYLYYIYICIIRIHMYMYYIYFFIFKENMRRFSRLGFMSRWSA